MLVGLLLETLADKKWFKSEKSRQSWVCSKKWVKDLDNVKFLYIAFRFLPNNATIEHGNVDLVANGAVRYTFEIPRQIPLKQFPDSPANAPWWVVATNSMEVFNRR